MDFFSVAREPSMAMVTQKYGNQKLETRILRWIWYKNWSHKSISTSNASRQIAGTSQLLMNRPDHRNVVIPRSA